MADLITSNVDAAPYESQSVIVRKYHIVSIRIGRRVGVKKYSRLYFNPPEYPLYVPTSHSAGDHGWITDEAVGGARKDGEGRRRRYFMGTGFYCARLLGHLLREACL